MAAVDNGHLREAQRHPTVAAFERDLLYLAKELRVTTGRWSEIKESSCSRVLNEARPRK